MISSRPRGAPTGDATATPKRRRDRGGRLRRDIEGLRAVAVLMVLLYHLRVPGAEGGFAGVDVFFVISGFLITGLMLREVEASGTLRLGRFYARRARRLLPAALLVTVATLLGGVWALPGSQLRDLVHDSIGATLYVVNWVLSSRAVDYLAEDAGVSPLQHYWSLSIEEQFYLLWPVLVLVGLGLAARSRLAWRPTLLGLLALVAAASLVYSVLLTASAPGQAYLSTFTRLWQLAAGALLAFAAPALTRLRPWASGLLVLVGLAAVLFTAVGVDAATAWPGWAAAVPVLGAAAVIAAGCSGRDTLGGRLLSTGPMVWLGGLSYALYLWHWPLIVLAEARWGELGATARAGLGVLAVLLAWVTKHAVEDPVRFQRRLAARPLTSLVAGGTGMALVCGLALAVLSTRPELQDRTDAPGPAALVADPAAQEWRLVDDPAHAFTRQGPLSPDPELAPEDIPPYYGDECQIAQGDPSPRYDCVYGNPDSPTEVLMVGDSKAGQWFSAVDAVAEQENWRLTAYLKSSCPFTVAGAEEEDCNAFGRTVVDHVTAQERPPALVLVSMGANRDPELEAGVRSALQALQETGARVVVLADNPYPPGSLYPCAAERPAALLECSSEVELAGGAELLGAVADDLDLTTINLNRWICPLEGTCPVAVGGILIWRQGSHLTDTYVRALTPFLYRELSALGLTERPAGDIALADVPDRSDG
ncbi:acyltransferase family protein [Ornithinimicrobium cavernae]|uniref:acyltransferase family protein n=1 Tax=Ornithinimicrobium cavernae TaxID=2666047 RepID=UPI000D68C7C2|nr:acyltransferase family protein [Ornithinimicrobium cavernae]